MNDFESVLLYNVMQRAEKAVSNLYDLGNGNTNELERKRILGKLEGVELMLGYIEEEMKIADDERG